MMRSEFPVTGVSAARQRGMVLIISMLLLLVVTLLAVAMFRSMGVGAKIAGNVREKQRALHAAESAEQYAANWLNTNAANGTLPQPSDCNQNVVNVNLGANQILVCSNAPYGPTTAQTITPNSPDTFVPSVVPWRVSGGAFVGFQFTPYGMTAGSCTGDKTTNTPSSQGVPGGAYVCPPMFFISQLGTVNNTTIYQIDALGYGATMDSVAVVESTYSVGSSSACLGGTGLGCH